MIPRTATYQLTLTFSSTMSRSSASRRSISQTLTSSLNYISQFHSGSRLSLLSTSSLSSVSLALSVSKLPYLDSYLYAEVAFLLILPLAVLALLALVNACARLVLSQCQFTLSKKSHVKSLFLTFWLFYLPLLSTVSFQAFR